MDASLKSRRPLSSRVDRGIRHGTPFSLLPALLLGLCLPRMAQAQPAIGVSPAVLTPATVTRPDVSPPNLQLTVSNTGDADLEYQISFLTGQWIKRVSPGGGTLAPGASSIHTVSFDTSKMTYNGLYQLAIRVGTSQAGAAVSSVTVPVNLTVDIVPPPPDEDRDGVPDATDGCPLDPKKTAPGQCGCGWPDTDTDQDTIADCNDNCIYHENPNQEDADGDGIGDVCEPLYLQELAEAEAQQGGTGRSSGFTATAAPAGAAAPSGTSDDGLTGAATNDLRTESATLENGETSDGAASAAPLPAVCGAGLLEAALAGLMSLGALRAVRGRMTRP